MNSLKFQLNALSYRKVVLHVMIWSTAYYRIYKKKNNTHHCKTTNAPLLHSESKIPRGT